MLKMRKFLTWISKHHRTTVSNNMRTTRPAVLYPRVLEPAEEQMSRLEHIEPFAKFFLAWCAWCAISAKKAQIQRVNCFENQNRELLILDWDFMEYCNEKIYIWNLHSKFIFLTYIATDHLAIQVDFLR